MTPEPNDRTPLDFTRALELVCDGTEVCAELVTLPSGTVCFLLRRTDRDMFTSEQHPFGHPGQFIPITDDGVWRADDPTGPQIVRNRVEIGDSYMVYLDNKRRVVNVASGTPIEDAQRLVVKALMTEPGDPYDGFVGWPATPAAPEPDGEVVERRFWLIVQNPGEVPRRKGPFLVTKTAAVLREFMAAHPTAYINVLTVDTDGTPDIEHGPETLQMLDGRSMSVGRRHNQRVRDAEAALTPPPPSSATPAEGMTDLADHLGHEAAAITQDLPAQQADSFAELRRAVELAQVGTLTVNVPTLKALLNASPPPLSSATPAEGMVEEGKHPSHITRFSDASSFDEVCTACGQTDIAGGGWGRLAEPCPATIQKEAP